MKLLREVVENDHELILIDESAFSPLLIEAEKKTKPEIEEPSSKRLGHLEHLEDMLLTGGPEGFSHVMSILSNTHDFLSGKQRNGYSIQTKFDGYPSIIWGHKDGKFFIGTKSFFNKTPKINFNEKDIEANHGKSPGLVKKLSFLFQSLKKVTPKQGVFQGDLMYSSEDVNAAGDNISFTPNTLTYNVDKNSHQGRKIMKSKLGIAAHSHYEESKNGGLQAVFDIDMSKFKPSDDVHFFPTKLRGPFNYSTKDMTTFATSIKGLAEKYPKLLKDGAFDKIKGHEQTLISYINDTVRRRVEPSFSGYVSFLHGKFQKKSSDSPALSSSMRKQMDSGIKDATENKKAFNAIFDAHKDIQLAKNALVGSLSKSSPYKETILGEPSKPEGFVITQNGQPVKMVDRQHFSSANFSWNEKSNPADNPLVLTWGRMNPPTAGHERVINKGEDIARRTGARHEVVASRSQDSKNNPLTPTQKVSWLKSMFPGKNVSVAAPDKSTLVAQLQHFHNQGVRDLTMVVGADRMKDYNDILAKYNGPGKLFHFNRARVISAGERDNQSKGVEGSSGSKQRDAAKKGDFKTFKMGLPSGAKPKDAHKMYHDMRAGMGVVKIDSMTNAHALAIYAKRTDTIGKNAIGEIDRRKRLGTWRGQSKDK
jgi:hypothetical protein